ncbi:MAG TPA: UbiA family prenyltransferase [Thermobifida alba]|nr:UbiA family prenyltransferase [Thermobifida alba]
MSIHVQETGLWSRTTVVPDQRSLRLAWSEARPAVQGIFQLRLLSGILIGAGGLTAVDWTIAVATALSWLLVTWSIYLINGVADQAEDVSNGSRRPIARGELDAATARRLAIVLGVCGLVAAASVSGLLLALAWLLLAVGWAYSTGPRPLQRTIAGVQLCVISGGLFTYLAGAHAADASLTPTLLVFAAAMSAWMGVGGLAKDLSDVVGDRRAGRRTLPVLRGERTARAAVTVAASAVAAGFLAGALAFAPVLLAAAAATLAGATALGVAALGPWSRAGLATPRLPYRIFMVTQYSVHALALAVLLLS